ncbi:hypothetical protein BJV74DRAFT_850375 [Russula compacta]|nr:hypothetical protein BJV74DRAFT_850375 [Russula compacta]
MLALPRSRNALETETIRSSVGLSPYEHLLSIFDRRAAKAAAKISPGTSQRTDSRPRVTCRNL